MQTSTAKFEGIEELVTMRRPLLRFFESNHCADPEELTDDTLFRVVNEMSRERAIENLKAFTYATARHVLLEFKRRSQRFGELPENLSVALETSDPSMDSIQRLRRCLQRLPADQRQLIEAYYSEGKGKDNRRELAETLNVSAVALRVRKHHVIEALRRCFWREHEHAR
jgi:RNA polymerase sigma factor (sigma-70 family)